MWLARFCNRDHPSPGDVRASVRMAFFAPSVRVCVCVCARARADARLSPAEEAQCVGVEVEGESGGGDELL